MYLYVFLVESLLQHIKRFSALSCVFWINCHHSSTINQQVFSLTLSSQVRQSKLSSPEYQKMKVRSTMTIMPPCITKIDYTCDFLSWFLTFCISLLQLLGWMHRKFRQNSNEPFKDLVIGKSSAVISKPHIYVPPNMH